MHLICILLFSLSFIAPALSSASVNVTLAAYIQSSNWLKAVTQVELQALVCIELAKDAAFFNISFDVDTCAVVATGIYVNPAILSEVNAFLNQSYYEAKQLAQAFQTLDNVVDDFAATPCRELGHELYAIARVTDPDGIPHHLARRLEHFQCRIWEKLHLDYDNYGIELLYTLANVANDAVIDFSSIITGDLFNLLSVDAAHIEVFLPRRALWKVLVNLQAYYAGYRAAHAQDQNEVQCHTDLVHTATHRIGRTAHRIEELDFLVALYLLENISFTEYQQFIISLDARFEVIVANQTNIDASASVDLHYHFHHLWRINFQAGDVVANLVTKWINFHNAVAYSLFKPHRFTVNTNCSSCDQSTCECYFDIDITPRPHHPRVLAYLETDLDLISRGYRNDVESEVGLEIAADINGAISDVIAANVRTNNFSASAFSADQITISAAVTVKAASQLSFDLEATYEDGDDVVDVFLDGLAEVALVDLEISRSVAAIRALNHSIYEANRRIHHIRSYYFELHLARDGVRLEIAKMENLYRTLKSDWQNNDCNCQNTSCKVPFHFVADAATTIPDVFFEGAVCEIFCRKNNISTVDVCNCSLNEGMQDDVAEDLAELFRLNRTLTRLVTTAETDIDITNATGFMKTLVDKRNEWITIRDALIANVTRTVAAVVQDLKNSTILDEICDIIHHCNENRHINCSCTYDSQSDSVICVHIVISTGNITIDVSNPQACHWLAVNARVGDVFLTKFTQHPPSQAGPTNDPGDQDPRYTAGSSSSDKRRAILQNSGNTIVTTETPVNSNSSTTTSAGSSSTGSSSSNSGSTSTGSGNSPSKHSAGAEFACSLFLIVVGLLATLIFN